MPGLFAIAIGRTDCEKSDQWWTSITLVQRGGSSLLVEDMGLLGSGESKRMAWN